jgi:hypothetical protein
LEAQEEVYKLMEADNFARFKQSDLFQRLLDKIGAYTGVTADSQSSRFLQRSNTLQRIDTAEQQFNLMQERDEHSRSMSALQITPDNVNISQTVLTASESKKSVSVVEL